MSKFSIIIPTYKRLSLLKKALLSVQNQKFDDFECLVINSYPADNNKIDSIKPELDDNRFVFIKSDKELNGNQARNIGIKRASAEYIAFLDDDDIWMPEKLLKHLDFHEKNKSVGLVFSKSIKKWEDNLFYDVVVPEIVPNLYNITDHILAGKFCPPTTSAVTVQRECFKSVGFFDENLISFQDLDMWLRISKKYSFGHIDECLTIFYQHLGDRTSQSTNKRLKGLKGIIKKHNLENKPFHKTYLIKTYTDTGFNRIISGEKWQSIKWIFKLIIIPSPTALLQAIKLFILLVFGLKFYTFAKNLFKS